MPASLFVVSTPIGNLDDITLRALSTLKAVGLIAAEDTRRTGTLLRHFGIGTPTTSLHRYNEQQKLPQLLATLAGGTDVALVSDAGTPIVADPGQRLIAAAIGQGIRVVPIPGASAVLSALAVSGFAADEFVFAGFSPSRSHDRKKWLSTLSLDKRAIVFFEAPHRIRKTLADLADKLVNRPIIIARELTKIHEEVIHTTALEAAGLQVVEKGEFTLIIGPDQEVESSCKVFKDKEIVDYFYHLTKTEGLLRRPALTKTAHYFGCSTKQVFSALERLKGSPPS